ncbi:MAG: M23 family metallopeptidase [Anaerolineae bacterium]|nr:M23 family metallopeptidase [Anaerolineae bacterium]
MRARRIIISVMGGVVFIALIGIVGLRVWRYRYGAISAGPVPEPLPEAQNPEIAEDFDFPLDPGRFGPYIPYVSGALPVDTRFDAQNPGVGSDGKCFVNIQGEQVPFNQLYHAGVDWFALDSKGKIQGFQGAGEPVTAVGNGVVTWVQSLGTDGFVIIIQHTLLDATAVWSVYWHVADVQVAVGEAVNLGQVVASLHNRGHNTHLHWEIRTFGDGSELFAPDSAGGRGTCNGYVAGVGYTWDDNVERARPEAWGYLDPGAFIESYRD